RFPPFLAANQIAHAIAVPSQDGQGPRIAEGIPCLHLPSPFRDAPHSRLPCIRLSWPSSLEIEQTPLPSRGEGAHHAPEESRDGLSQIDLHRAAQPRRREVNLLRRG